VNISVKKITHFGMIYNEVLLTRQTPSGNANRRIFCAAGNNKKIISKTVAFRAKLWYDSRNDPEILCQGTQDLRRCGNRNRARVYRQLIASWKDKNPQSVALQGITGFPFAKKLVA